MYRSWPMWAKIVVPAAVVVAGVGAVGGQNGDVTDSAVATVPVEETTTTVEATTSTTTVAPTTTKAPTTTAAPTTTTRPASTPTTTRAPVAPTTAAPAPVQPSNPGDSKNCGDFSTYAEAKSWFDTYSPYYGDVARLDQDGDLIPCESLPGAPG